MNINDRAITRALKLNRRTFQKYNDVLNPTHTEPATQPSLRTGTIKLSKEDATRIYAEILSLILEIQG